jgi:hypothetical protein
MRHLGVYLVCLGSWVVAAHADGGAHAAAASEHFRAANRAFLAGRYELALDELRSSYAIEPRPEFHIAFAQAYRKLGRLDDAIEECERFLEAAPDAPMAASVRKLARKLRSAATLATAPPSPQETSSSLDEPRLGQSAPEPQPPAASAPPPSAPPASTLGTSHVAVAAQPPPLATLPAQRREADAAPRSRRALIIGISLGAVVVGIAVGVGVGIGLGAPSGKLPTLSFDRGSP